MTLDAVPAPSPVRALNPLVRRTAFPAILEARRWLADYDGSRGPALDLSQAAPPYPPPPELLAHLAAAAGDAETARYGKVPGEDALRLAYASHLSRLYRAPVAADAVAITAGANQAFTIAAMLVAGAGDAAVLPAPWYFNHKMTLDMLGIEARPLPCGDGFLPDLTALGAMLDARVRAVVLVTPNNPTGAIYPPALLAEIAAVCRARGVWLIIDETYRDFLPDEAAPHGLLDPAMRDGVIGVYSFSKSLAIPGHRLGAMVFPPAAADDVTKIQDCLQICPPRAAQIAATWALGHLDGWRREKRRFFAEQAIAFRAAMRDAPQWEVQSTGGYFAFVRFPPHSSTSSADVAERLARENGVLCLPGTYFGPGGEAFLRVSIGALSGETLTSFPERLRLR